MTNQGLLTNNYHGTRTVEIYYRGKYTVNINYRGTRKLILTSEVHGQLL